MPTICTVYLTGVFRVEAADGEDITPKSRVRCALLAVLASSPNLALSRLRLQMLFWGNSNAKQASGSLRSALFKLHKDFSSINESLIETHTNHVSLSAKYWNIVKAPAHGEFLEGLDLPLKGADEFEGWLRDERLALTEIDLTDAIDSPQQTRLPAQGSTYSLGILPTAAELSNTGQFAVTDGAIDSLIALLSQLSSITIFDLRGATLTTGSLSCANNTANSFFLKSSAHKTGKHWVLRLSLVEPHTNRLVISLKPIFFKNDEVSVDLSHIAELILGAFVPEHSPAVLANLLPWAALSSLFSLSSNAVFDTEAEIDRLLLNGHETMLPTLKIFVQIFKQNEGLIAQKPHDLQDLQFALEQVPITSSLRPLCESLIGYSAHMLCAENEVGEYLLNTAFKRAPNLAINLDHLSALHLARGNLNDAVKYHERCMRFSALSSWRYSYDITGAMIALALGDYRTALRHSNRALMQRPQFIGALRYTMIGFAMNEDPESAHQIRSRIITLRPNYDLSGWIEVLLRRSDAVFGNNVAITLRQLELI